MYAEHVRSRANKDREMTNYDLLQTHVTADCGLCHEHICGGEIFWAKPMKDKPKVSLIVCLACAAKEHQPSPPIDMVVQSIAKIRRHYAEALRDARITDITRRHADESEAE